VSLAAGVAGVAAAVRVERAAYIPAPSFEHEHPALQDLKVRALKSS